MSSKTEDREAIKAVPYHEAIELCPIRNQINTIDIVSRFYNNPDITYWQVVKRILCYLKEVRDWKLCVMSESNNGIIGYRNWETLKIRNPRVTCSKRTELPFLRNKK